MTKVWSGKYWPSKDVCLYLRRDLTVWWEYDDEQWTQVGELVPSQLEDDGTPTHNLQQFLPLIKDQARAIAARGGSSGAKAMAPRAAPWAPLRSDYVSESEMSVEHRKLLSTSIGVGNIQAAGEHLSNKRLVVDRVGKTMPPRDWLRNDVPGVRERKEEGTTSSGSGEPQQRPAPSSFTCGHALSSFAILLVPPAFLTSPAYTQFPMFSEAPRENYDLEYFRSYPQCVALTVSDWKEHNRALMFGRDTAELANGIGPQSFLLCNTQPWSYATTNAFNETRMIPWSWREMVQAIDDGDASKERNRDREGRPGLSDLEIVVGTGIKEVRLESTANYRRQTRLNTEDRLWTWNFCIMRTNNIYCRLHPERDDNLIHYIEGRCSDEPAYIPRSGPGHSDGFGTGETPHSTTHKKLKFDLSRTLA